MTQSQRSVPTSASALDEASRALLEVQRRALAKSLSEAQPEPSVGDVWASRVQWATGVGQGLASMIVVLRSFTEAWSARPLYDVAPLSDDERLSSEWSLIVDSDLSGVGFPIIAHIDAQCTTTAAMLTSRMGDLAEHARADLHLMLEAFAVGDYSPLKLKVGRTGRRGIRHLVEWDEFAKGLLAVTQALAAPLLDRNNDNSYRASAIASEYGVALVRESPPEDYGGRWRFRPNPPQVIEIAPSDVSVICLGHVVAEYVKHEQPRWFDSSVFTRMQVVFSVPALEVVELHALKLIASLKAKVPPHDTDGFDSGDWHRVATVCRWYKSRASRSAGGPTVDRLAARKADRGTS